MSRITKIQYNNSQDIYNFGATFDDIIYKENNTQKYFTLTHLYNFLKNFFNNGTFMMYSDKEPADQRVKIWYNTSIQQ